MLEKVKAVLGITVEDYDEEIYDLIEAAKADMGIAGITEAQGESDPLIIRGINLYCKMHFGAPEDFDRLERAYGTLKGQLQVATGYTNWGEA